MSEEKWPSGVESDADLSDLSGEEDDLSENEDLLDDLSDFVASDEDVDMDGDPLDDASEVGPELRRKVLARLETLANVTLDSMLGLTEKARDTFLSRTRKSMVAAASIGHMNPLFQRDNLFNLTLPLKLSPSLAHLLPATQPLSFKGPCAVISLCRLTMFWQHLTSIDCCSTPIIESNASPTGLEIPALYQWLALVLTFRGLAAQYLKLLS